MSDALFFGIAALIAAGIIALALVWPAGDAGKPAPPPAVASAPPVTAATP